MGVQILIGDCRKVLATLPSDSVDCIITSPPYWGLRSYGTNPQVWGGEEGCAHEWGDVRTKKGGAAQPGEKVRWQHVGQGPSGHPAFPAGTFCQHCGAWRGELGQEPTLDVWLRNMVVIFRDLRRVLKPTGCCWLNCGDAYASTPNGRSAAATKEAGRDDRTFRDRPVSTVGVLKAKQRMMMPARLAIALQDDGWWIRDEIIWHKPNPMPSSVKDRTTPAHEMVYLLTKRARYYYDYVAVMEPMSDVSLARLSQPNIHAQTGGAKQDAFEAEGLNKRNGSRRPNQIVQGLASRWDASEAHRRLNNQAERLVAGEKWGARHEGWQATAADRNALRQRRSVWSIATQPMREAHFATFPEALVEPMILAGSGHRGCCADCGKPWERVVETRYVNPGNRTTNGPRSLEQRHETQGHAVRLEAVRDTASWRPTCVCFGRFRRVPAVVLDPFGGSGTVGLVAQRHQRDAILIELNPQYAEIARARIDAERDTLFTQLTVKEPSDADKPKPPAGGAGSLDPVAGDGGAAAADGL